MKDNQRQTVQFFEETRNSLPNTTLVNQNFFKKMTKKLYLGTIQN